MKKKSSSVKLLITAVLLVVVGVLAFNYFKNRTTPLINRGSEKKTELELLMEKDIMDEYPSTPREMLKLYSRYARIFYNEKLKDENIVALAEQLRLLFDEELLLNNPMEEYLLELKTEISIYREVKRTMVSYVVQSNQGISYWESDNESYASVIVSYTLKEGSDYTKLFQKFMLRKDESSNWKILGWSITEEVDLSKAQ